jgi:hypothetical protein
VTGPSPTPPRHARFRSPLKTPAAPGRADRSSARRRQPALRAQAQAEAPQERACRTEVSKFEETISFLRHTQGMEAAAKLKEELLPAKLESEILMQQGYCGLARHLRDKHLL